MTAADHLSAPRMIELRLLGPVDLRSPEGSGAAHVLSQPKRLALLAYLAAAKPTGFQRRDTLVVLFWPELDQEHARAALRNTLHFLRRELADRVIVTRGDEVAIDASVLWCDAAEFDRALDAGHPERALALYRGDFLKGLHVSDAPEFDRWSDAERERRRRRARDGAWSLAGADESTSFDDAAVHWMRVALDIDPDDEPGLHRLLRSLVGVGDRAGAIREYERFAHRLAAEYDLEPSPETRALAAAIRSRHQGSDHSDDFSHRAMQDLSRYSERGLTRALEHAQNGLPLAGENELLLATMAYVYVQFLELGVEPDRGYLDRAEELAVRALRTDVQSCLAHVVKGLLSYKRGDIEGSARDLSRALEIDPNQRDALFWLTLVSLAAGREQVVRPLLARLHDLDCLTPVSG